MAKVDELVRQIANQTLAHKRTSFFINGMPGSGKSHLLADLEQQLPRQLTRCVPLGPYSIHVGDMSHLAERIIQDCRDAGFLDEAPASSHAGDLVSAWQWITAHRSARPGQTLMVLIDVQGAHWADVSMIQPLFSSARQLEARTSEQDLNLHHIIAGCWDHSALAQYYQTINTSFPYTSGHNYVTWHGFGAEEMDNLVRAAFAKETQPWHGRLLLDLTGGHPGVAKEILAGIRPNTLGIDMLLEATRRAAQIGPMRLQLLEIWRQLSATSRKVLGKLYIRHRLRAAGVPAASVDQLTAAGVIKQEVVGSDRFLAFRCWYVELMVHYHAEMLGIADHQTSKIRQGEMMPEIPALAEDAYRLINILENAVRGFVVTQLCLKTAPEHHILEGRCLELSRNTGAAEDAKQRAEEWRERRLGGDTSEGLSPLIAYCSTRDLAGLVDELDTAPSAAGGRSLVQAIRELADIRDIVMHNQIIDDATMRRLYALQPKLYAAMDQ